MEVFDEEEGFDDDFDEDALSYDDDELEDTLVEEHPFEDDEPPQAV